MLKPSRYAILLSSLFLLTLALDKATAQSQLTDEQRSRRQARGQSATATPVEADGGIPEAPIAISPTASENGETCFTSAFSQTTRRWHLINDCKKGIRVRLEFKCGSGRTSDEVKIGGLSCVVWDMRSAAPMCTELINELSPSAAFTRLSVVRTACPIYPGMRQPGRFDAPRIDPPADVSSSRQELSNATGCVALSYIGGDELRYTSNCARAVTAIVRMECVEINSTTNPTKTRTIVVGANSTLSVTQSGLFGSFCAGMERTRRLSIENQNY